jgi:hypothetical protein
MDHLGQLCPEHDVQENDGLLASAGALGDESAAREHWDHQQLHLNIKCQCGTGEVALGRERQTHAGHQKLETRKFRNTLPTIVSLISPL